MCTVSMRKERRKDAGKQTLGQRAPPARPARGRAATKATLQLARGVRVSLIPSYVRI